MPLAYFPRRDRSSSTVRAGRRSAGDRTEGTHAEGHPRRRGRAARGPGRRGDVDRADRRARRGVGRRDLRAPTATSTGSCSRSSRTPSTWPSASWRRPARILAAQAGLRRRRRVLPLHRGASGRRALRRRAGAPAGFGHGTPAAPSGDVQARASSGWCSASPPISRPRWTRARSPRRRSTPRWSTSGACGTASRR